MILVVPGTPEYYIRAGPATKGADSLLGYAPLNWRVWMWFFWHGVHCAPTNGKPAPFLLAFVRDVWPIERSEKIPLGDRHFSVKNKKGAGFPFFCTYILRPFVMEDFFRFKNGPFSQKAKQNGAVSSQIFLNSSLTRRPWSFRASELPRLEVANRGSNLIDYVCRIISNYSVYSIAVV